MELWKKVKFIRGVEDSGQSEIMGSCNHNKDPALPPIVTLSVEIGRNLSGFEYVINTG